MKNSTVKKTNAMRILEQKKANFSEHSYDPGVGTDGETVAKAVGLDPDMVFKTLVTEGKSKEHYVFVIPVNKELDLKKAAAAVGEKSVAMIKQKELLPLTGYIHGGCSPIGMKKFFRTTIHKSAGEYETITFSAGEIGKQVELSLEELKKVIEFELFDVAQ